MTYRPITDVWILARPRLRGGAKLYGAYPGGYLERARALLGVSIADPVLHVCGGMVRLYAYPKRAVGPNDKTLDLDPLMKPDFCQDARGAYPTGFAGILADPPYGPDEADRYAPGRRALPTANVIAKRAIEAIGVGRRVGILCYQWAAPPANAVEIAVVAVLTGRNQRPRQLTVLERLA